MKPLQIGDYVLATKYHDGSPRDNWAVGFFAGMFHDRFLVVDSDGHSFRATGFRRAERISQEIGAFLVNNRLEIETGGRNLWGLRRRPKDESRQSRRKR